MLHSLSQQSITHPKYSNHSIPCDVPDASIFDNNTQGLDDDDDDDESDHSFVPNESELESFSDESSEEEEEEHNEIRRQKKDPDLTTPVTRRKSKGTPNVTPKKTNSASSRRTRSRERVSSSTARNLSFPLKSMETNAQMSKHDIQAARTTCSS